MGLLLFGHYWGVLGMVVSTPLMAVVKQIYLFLDEKHDFFKNNDENDNNESNDNTEDNKKDKDIKEEKKEDKDKKVELEMKEVK
jgi:hypothetical protein